MRKSKAKKRIVSAALALSAFFALPLSACGKKDDENGGNVTPSEEIKAEDVEYMAASSAPDYPAISEENEAKYVTYYFAADGNDEAAGTSGNAPLKSVAKANEIIANAGETPTKLLFKAGDTFVCEYEENHAYKKGELLLAGHSAKEETPLVVGVYAKTEENRRAILTSEATAVSEIVRIRESNTRVFDLELTGEKIKAGVRIYSEQGTETKNGGAMKNVVASGLYIHDINVNYTGNQSEKIRAAYAAALEKKSQGVFDYMPDPETDFDNDASSIDDVQSIVSDGAFNYGTGGVMMGAGTSRVNGPTWLENVWIENNEIERVARCGMFLSGSWVRRPGWDNGTGSYYYDEETGEEKGYYPLKGIVVRGNTLDYTGGDGIVLLNARDSFVENNISYHAQYLGRSSSSNFQAGYSVPIWLHSCTNVLMQYNEAAHCFMANGCHDGQGFDIDIGNRNIVFRYNYSHHNAGGGLLITNRSTTDLVYDKDGEKKAEDSWYDMNGNLVTGDDNLNKGIPVKEKWYILLENIYVHNNVFAYNDLRVFNFAGPTKNLQICNNTVLLDGKERKRGSEMRLLLSEDMGNTGVRAKEWLFANNIFWQKQPQPVIFDETFSDSCVLENNVFYNFEDAFFDFGAASMHLSSTVFGKYSRENPDLAETEAKNGIGSAQKIAARAAYLKDFAAYQKIMQRKDLCGGSASGEKYVGAILNK